jgi:hypothetical protein
MNARTPFHRKDHLHYHRKQSPRQGGRGVKNKKTFWNSPLDHQECRSLRGRISGPLEFTPQNKANVRTQAPPSFDAPLDSQLVAGYNGHNQ